MDFELEKRWQETVKFIESKFGEGHDLQSILFLIGVQELGKGYQKFKKDQKIELMHVAICTLLEPYGYYKYIGNDKDGWPHFDVTDKLPYLEPKNQEKLMKEAVIEYFRPTLQ